MFDDKNSTVAEAQAKNAGGGVSGVGRGFWGVWVQGCLWLSVIGVSTVVHRVSSVNFGFYFSAHHRGFFEEVSRLLREADAFFLALPLTGCLWGGLLVYMAFRRITMPADAFGVYQLSLLRSLRNYACLYALVMLLMTVYQKNPFGFGFGFDNNSIGYVAATLLVIFVIKNVLQKKMLRKKRKGAE